MTRRPKAVDPAVSGPADPPVHPAPPVPSPPLLELPCHDPLAWSGATCGQCQWAFQFAYGEGDQISRDTPRCYYSPPTDRGRPQVGINDPACSRFTSRNEQCQTQ